MSISNVVIAKSVVRVIVGSGTTKIVSAIIKNNVQAETLISKIQVNGAAFVLGAVVADVSKSYTDEKIDSFVAAWKKANAKPEETEEKTEEQI